jgi:plastocyanin
MPHPRNVALARLAALSLCLLAAGSALAENGAVIGKVNVQPGRFQDETVVYLKDAPPSKAVATHEMDQKNMKFLPIVLVVAVGDTVTFLNHDHDEHNVYSPDGEPFNLGTFKNGQTRSHVFEDPGPNRIKCSIHPEMLGHVFVAPSRYAAVVDRKGRFVIADVPPGTYRLAVWNANLPGTEKTVTIAAGKTSEETLSIQR